MWLLKYGMEMTTRDRKNIHDPLKSLNHKMFPLPTLRKKTNKQTNAQVEGEKTEGKVRRRGGEIGEGTRALGWGWHFPAEIFFLNDGAPS